MAPVQERIVRIAQALEPSARHELLHYAELLHLRQLTDEPTEPTGLPAFDLLPDAPGP